MRMARIKETSAAFYLLLYVPQRRQISDEELLRRVGHLYDAAWVRNLASELKKRREAGLEEAAEALNALLSRTKVVRARLAGRDPSGAEPPQPASQQTLGPAGQVVSFTPRSAVSAASVLARYAMALDSVPEMPSRALEAEIRAAEQDGRTVLKQVSDLLGPGLRKLNGILKRAKLPVVEPIETESDDLGPIGFGGDDEVGQ